MTAPTAFQVGRVLWEARKREAWGPLADTMMARAPWPPHEAHPDRAEEHALCIAEAKALLKQFEVSPR